MKTICRQSVAVLIVCLALATPGQAKEKESEHIEELNSSLKNLVFSTEKHGKYKDRWKTDYSFTLSEEQLVVEYSFERTMDKNGVHKDRTEEEGTYTASLEDLAGATVEVSAEDGRVSLRCPDNSKCFEVSYTLTYNHKDRSDSDEIVVDRTSLDLYVPAELLEETREQLEELL